MKIKDFGVEQWMNEYETKAKYNLGETCVSSLSIRELCELVGVDVNDFAKQLVDRRLTYGAIEGAVELKEAITRLYLPEFDAGRDRDRTRGDWGEQLGLKRPGGTRG